jgi:hypothetical protein
VPAEPAQHYAHLRVAHGLHRRHREGTQMRSGVRTNFYPIASSSFFTHITNNHPTYTLMGFDLTSHNSTGRQYHPRLQDTSSFSSMDCHPLQRQG